MKTILESQTLEGQQKELDELMVVHSTLRNFCQNIKNPKQAVKLIAKKTGLTEDRVKEIIIKINQ